MLISIKHLHICFTVTFICMHPYFTTAHTRFLRFDLIAQAATNQKTPMKPTLM